MEQSKPASALSRSMRNASADCDPRVESIEVPSLTAAVVHKGSSNPNKLVVDAALAAAGARKQPQCQSAVPAGSRPGKFNKCATLGFVFPITNESENLLVCKECKSKMYYEFTFNAGGKASGAAPGSSSYMKAGIEATSKQTLKQCLKGIRNERNVFGRRLSNNVTDAKSVSTTRLLKRPKEQAQDILLAPRANQVHVARPAAPPQQGEVLEQHLLISDRAHVGHLQHWQRTGGMLADFIRDPQGQWTLDFLCVQTVPQALKDWSNGWDVGGATHNQHLDAFKGDMALAKCPFWHLRIDAPPEFMQRLAIELTKTGKTIARDSSASGKRRFSATSRDYMSEELCASLLDASTLPWNDEANPVKLYVCNFGGNLPIYHFISIGKKVQQSHLEFAGALLAKTYAQEAVVDTGVEWVTEGLVAVAPTNKTAIVAGEHATITSLPQWGAKGKNFGSIFIHGIDGTFSKALMCNAEVHFLRSNVKGLYLGKSAVYSNAANNFMKDTFKPMMKAALASLANESHENRFRVEVRQRNAAAVGCEQAFDMARVKALEFANSIVAISIERSELVEQATQAFEAATAAGVFSFSNGTGRAIVPKWKYKQGNKLAQLIHWDNVQTHALSHEWNVKNYGWGNIEGDPDLAKPYAVEIPIGFSLQPKPRYTPWIPDPELQGHQFTTAAHTKALEIKWERATGEPAGNAPIASQLKEIALYVAWRKTPKGSGLTITKCQSRGTGGNLGASLEEASLKILTEGMQLETLAKFKPGNGQQCAPQAAPKKRRADDAAPKKRPAATLRRPAAALSL